MHKRQKKKRAKQSSWEVIEHEIFGGFAAHYSTQANLDLLLWKQMIHWQLQSQILHVELENMSLKTHKQSQHSQLNLNEILTVAERE